MNHADIWLDQQVLPWKWVVLYVPRGFGLFVSANNIAEGKKVPLFLTVLRGSTYRLLHNLMVPDNPKDKSFETITGVLKAHFETPHHRTKVPFSLQRSGSRRNGSRISGRTWCLASNCNFGAYLDQVLWVCGQQSEVIQKCLLSEPEPTLAHVPGHGSGPQAGSDAKTLDTVVVGKVDKCSPSQESAKGVKKFAVGKQATYSRTVASRKSHATPVVKRVTFPECAKVPEVTAATLRGPNGLTHTPNSLNRLE